MNHPDPTCCIFRLLAIVFCILAIPSAYSGQQTGKIDWIITRASDGLVYFNLTGTHDAKPACAAQSYWMIKDESSAAGKRQLAMLLLARATDKEVQVFGTNACSRWGDGEDVDSLKM
jgi:hypothetical protein